MHGNLISILFYSIPSDSMVEDVRLGLGHNVCSGDAYPQSVFGVLSISITAQVEGFPVRIYHAKKCLQGNNTMDIEGSWGREGCQWSRIEGFGKRRRQRFRKVSWMK